MRRTLAALLGLYGKDARQVADAYRIAFRADARVLRDLAGFARINEASPDDPMEARRIEGRREVFWHIANMLRLDPLEIEKLVNEEGWKHDA